MGMLNNASSLLLALASFVLVSNFANEAHAASWKIRVDNWGNPDKPGYWSTTDDIEVKVCYYGFFSCDTVGWINGPTGVNNFDITVPESFIPFFQADSVELVTTGSNMFVVDQIEIFNASGTLVRTYGLDNMKGWCLSTASTDGPDVACDSHGAWKLWGFEIKNNQTYRRTYE